MLKGKSIIELTNVKTGEKEVIEEENMVTNALNELFKPYSIAKDCENIFSKAIFSINAHSSLYYCQSLLGGLILWDKSIVEDPNQIFPPNDVNPVGYALYGQYNTTSSVHRGSYNPAECEYNESQKSMKFVYDFSTSQCNGTIASLSLTSVLGGYQSYGSDDAVQTNLGCPMAFWDFARTPMNCDYIRGEMSDVVGKEVLFLTDIQNNVYYSLRVTSPTTATVVKRSLGLSSLSLFGEPYSNCPIIEEIDLPEFSTNFLRADGTGGFTSNYDRKNNCVYFIFNQGYATVSDGSNAIRVIKLNMDDLTSQIFIIVNNTGTTLVPDIVMSLYVYDDYLYTYGPNYLYTHLYRIKIDNSADVTLITDTSPANFRQFVMEISGRIYVTDYNYTSGRQYTCILDTKNDRILHLENSMLYISGSGGNNKSRALCVQDLNSELIFYYGASNMFRSHVNYLATINNLPTPVQKTADKVMKITYIVQEV